MVLLLGLLGLTSNGCESSKVQCDLLCVSTITFALTTPVAGSDIAISMDFPDHTNVTLDCQAGDASWSCTPLPAQLIPIFDAQGSLSSMTTSSSSPLEGQYHLTITVDGVPKADTTVQYARTPNGSGCAGSPCYKPATFPVTTT